jgi:monoterpene epsilon-lactone hydrolase
MAARIQFNGPVRYGIRSTALLCGSVVTTCLRRLIKGPRRPSWNLAFEIGTQVLKRNLAIAFAMRDANEARRYLDSVVLNSPELSQVSITASPDEKVRGSWFVRHGTEPRVTLLYLHGGGYSFYPKTYANLIASVTLAARSKTFALDYRLSPEYRFPSQLEDALAAYRWLLNSGVNAENLVVAGDSAGGNLTLALLLSARDAGLPAPALAIALSPATDFVTPVELGGRASITANEEFDWIQRTMLIKWADWFCRPDQREDTLVSPIYADLSGLPPIYIQAGRAEILYDSIQAFADRARTQGANVVLESWDDMNHDFQMFGRLAPQSVQAFRRIGEVIEGRMAADPAQANTGLERPPSVV